MSSADQPSTLPPVLRLFAAVTAALSVACFGIQFVCRHIAALHFDRMPYAKMTLISGEDHIDTWMFDVRFLHYHEASFFSTQWGAAAYLYPAPIAFFYRLLRFFPNPTVAMLSFLGIAYLGLALWLVKALIQRGLSRRSAILFVAVSLVFSYPLYFEFNRANMEIFVWALSALGVLAFFRNRPWLAATLIGCAAACKGYPALYLGLLFARRQYRQVVYSIVVAAVVNAISLWAIAGKFAIGSAGVAAGLDTFRQTYVLHRRGLEIGLDHSLFGFLKRFWRVIPAPEQLAHVLTFFLVATGLIAAALYFFRVLKLPPLNQLIFLTACCLLLPPVSYDYTLIHLYTPWVMLVFLAFEMHRRGTPAPRGLWLAMICYTILLSPQNEVIRRAERLEGQIKCLALLALAAVALCYPLYTGSTPQEAEAVTAS